MNTSRFMCTTGTHTSDFVPHDLSEKNYTHTRCLTPEMFADRVCMSSEYIGILCRNGSIPAHKCGRCWLIEEIEVERFIGDVVNQTSSDSTVDQLQYFLLTVENSKPHLNKRDNNFYSGLKRLVYICIATGIRRREALLILREDVDLEKNRVSVMNIKHSKKIKRWITIPIAVIEDFEWFLENYPGDKPFYICHPDTLTHWVKR